MRSARVMLWFLLATLAASGETRVRVTGVSHRSEGQVLEMMGGRLTHVRASPASAPLADDAAFLLRQILRKDGYADAVVDWRIAAGDEIVLSVREGKRLSLGKVQVNGVPAEDAKKFSRLYAKPTEKDRPLGRAAPPFREQDVETGLSFLRQELNANGYWDAQARVAQRVENPATGALDFTIEVNRGASYVIAAPTVTSVDGRGVKLTKTVVQPFVGRIATTGNLNEMRLAVEESAVSRGYPDAKIRMARTLAPGKFIPAFSIDLGTRVRLHRIRVEGLKRTDPKRIEKRLKPMEGEWYDEAAMNRRLREFLATGAFSSARAETSDAGERLVDATLHFSEAKAREVTLAAGLGSYQGFITRVGYIDRNLFGKLLGLNTGMELGSRGVLGEARVTDPWVLGHDVAATARVFALIYGREGYSTLETGIDGMLGWKFGDHYKLDLLAGNSLVNLSSEGLPTSELGETVYTHHRLRLTQTLDFRDNPVLPTRGWHLECPLELGAAVGDFSTSYGKAGISGGWFHDLGRNYQIGLGGDWGILMPSGDGGDLPIDLRLFNGGARSVRSFPERELGPSADGYPTGGEAMWNANAELIRSISGAVEAVVFFDAGTLDRNYEEMGAGDVELATGLGIRLNLPIGPVRLEYGFNLTRDPGEPAGAFHFAIGNAF